MTTGVIRPAEGATGIAETIHPTEATTGTAGVTPPRWAAARTCRAEATS
jgi:hypothetical protein